MSRASFASIDARLSTSTSSRARRFSSRGGKIIRRGSRTVPRRASTWSDDAADEDAHERARVHLPFGGARGDETASTSTWGRDGGGVGDEDDAETREFPSLFGFSGLFGVPRGAVSRWDSKPTPLRGLTEEQVPRHVAVIMDGNSRWAERRRLPRTIGHERGVNALRGAVKCCASWGVRTLTVFAFSEENWGRNQMEVEELMALVETTMRDELPLLVKEGVRVEVIGDLRKVNVGVREAVTRAVEATKENDALRLVIALSYGGRQDIVKAARALARKVAAGEIHPDDIDEDAISAHLSTHDAIAAANDARFTQAPDLLIRTSGEQRLSNFLLWDLAYTELYFANTVWPEFGEAELRRAIHAYAKRDRRFGGRARPPTP